MVIRCYASPNVKFSLNQFLISRVARSSSVGWRMNCPECERLKKAYVTATNAYIELGDAIVSARKAHFVSPDHEAAIKAAEFTWKQAQDAYRAHTATHRVMPTDPTNIQADS
jgi:hypothetical protein